MKLISQFERNRTVERERKVELYTDLLCKFLISVTVLCIVLTMILN